MATSERLPYGRPVTIELRRVPVTTLLMLVALGLVLGGWFLLTIPEDYSRHAAAHFVGWLSFPCALYVGVLGFRVATWPRLYVKLTRSKLEFPSIHGLTTRQVELDLRELEDIGFVSAKGTTSSAVWAGGKRHQVAVPFWLPKDWSSGELTRRIHLRWEAAKLGLGGPELAAVEAAWDSRRAAGLAVRRKGKKWKALATVEDEEDYERRREEGAFGDRSELILADDVMPRWRDVRDALYLPKPKKGWSPFG